MKLFELLKNLGAQVAQKHPGWAFSCVGSRIEFPKLNDDGFAVAVDVDEKSVYLETDTGWHSHFHEPSESELAGLSGMVRDLLSENMRIRELRAGSSGYRWHLEVFDGKNWRDDGTTGLIFWNFFGQKSEKVYRNNHLPPRNDCMNWNAKDAT